jgi:RimJ/RimL family protein N-acetyltransferase
VGTLLRLCFEDLGLRRVTAQCFADNTASWRLMERVGMRRETHGVADSLHRSGAWLDGFGYALLADEWRRTAARPDGGPV